MTLAWGMDFPPPALGTKVPAASIACSLLVLCCGMLQQTPSWTYGLQMGLTQTTQDASQQLSWISGHKWSLASFYWQHSHRPKVSQVNNFGTDLLLYLLVMVGVCCWFSTTTAVEKWEKHKCQVMSFIPLQGRHLEIRKSQPQLQDFKSRYVT